LVYKRIKDLEESLCKELKDLNDRSALPNRA
jgi:hypothetical protein